MHGGVDPVDLARGVRSDQGRRPGHVGIHQFGIEDGVGVAALDPGQRLGGHCGNPGGDLNIGRRHDLRTVTKVDLVAVVLGRIVGGSHHDPGHAAEVANAEGNHRGGQRTGAEQRRKAGPGQDLGSVAGEHSGVVAGVVADDYPAAGHSGVEQVAGQAGRGLGDDHPVHPGRAGSQPAP